MKKLFFAFLLTSASVLSFAQCIPDFTFTTPGFKPHTTVLPCAEQGVAYNQVITIRNFTSVPGYAVDSLKFDSISNLPCGLKYAFSKPNQTYLGGESGCILIYGTTSDPVGQYKIGMYAKIYGTPDLPAPLEGTSQRLDLVAPLGGYDFRYFVRVAAVGVACAALDTTPAFAGNKTSTCIAQNTTDVKSPVVNQATVSTFPSPANEQFSIHISSEYNEMVYVKLISAEGKEVLNTQKEISVGDNLTSLQISALPKGIYQLILAGPHVSYVTKLFKN